jgi:hypothetical protein
MLIAESSKSDDQASNYRIKVPSPRLKNNRLKYGMELPLPCEEYNTHPFV